MGNLKIFGTRKVNDFLDDPKAILRLFFRFHIIHTCFRITLNERDYLFFDAGGDCWAQRPGPVKSRRGAIVDMYNDPGYPPLGENLEEIHDFSKMSSSKC